MEKWKGVDNNYAIGRLNGISLILIKDCRDKLKIITVNLASLEVTI
jgi:hypothetical protein